MCWRSAGGAPVPRPGRSNAPLRAESLGEFWGRRWNLGFRDLAHAHVFRPLARKLGAAGATLAAFAVSGAVHDLVISGPARAGWGLPTLYFLLQGCGVLLERSRAGRRFGLGRGTLGRLFTAIVTIAPLGMLFHRPFVERIVLPMLSEIGAR
jgi:alginate O-acetyltransferase complex protein AlgI